MYLFLQAQITRSLPFLVLKTKRTEGCSVPPCHIHS